MTTRDLDARLARQNNVTGWVDCNAVDLPHRWVPGATATTAPGPVFFWYRCTRCPVSTRYTAGKAPARFLRRAS